MRLIHHSDKLLTKIHDKEQKGMMFEMGNKPCGLWFSVDGEDSWKEWCEGEQFNLDGLQVENEILLAPDANILHIATVEHLLEFTREYKQALSWTATRYAIDWKSIVQKYDGIIIAPYQWKARLEEATFWYYSWDCASGCV